jgi:hypothetical protein
LPRGWQKKKYLQSASKQRLCYILPSFLSPRLFWLGSGRLFDSSFRPSVECAGGNNEGGTILCAQGLSLILPADTTGRPRCGISMTRPRPRPPPRCPRPPTTPARPPRPRLSTCPKTPTPLSRASSSRPRLLPLLWARPTQLARGGSAWPRSRPRQPPARQPQPQPLRRRRRTGAARDRAARSTAA